jgi:hypothetical protein
MCTFENEHRVLVCDVAIHQVREAVSAAFGDAVQFTPAEGAGTRVEVLPSIDEKVFQEVAREAIAAAQQKNGTSNQ